MESTQVLNVAYNIAKAIDYNPEKVNVKQLMKTTYGGINLVAMQKGQKLDEHRAPAAVNILVLEGSVRFIVEGKNVELSAGNAIMMEAGTPHNVETLENSKIMIAMLDN